MSEVFAATGRRKTAVAQVRVSRGSGKIEVNGRPLEEYFSTPSLQFTVLKPFEVTKTSNSFDVKVRTTGGGITGQAGAIRLAISRALLAHDAALRPVLANGPGPGRLPYHLSPILFPAEPPTG